MYTLTHTTEKGQPKTIITFEFFINGGTIKNMRQCEVYATLKESDIDKAIEVVSKEYGLKDLFHKYANANINRILSYLKSQHEVKKIKVKKDKKNTAAEFQYLLRCIGQKFDIPHNTLVDNTHRVKQPANTVPFSDFMNSKKLDIPGGVEFHVLTSTLFDVAVIIQCYGKIETLDSPNIKWLLAIENNSETNIVKKIKDALKVSK